MHGYSVDIIFLIFLSFENIGRGRLVEYGLSTGGVRTVALSIKFHEQTKKQSLVFSNIVGSHYF